MTTPRLKLIRDAVAGLLDPRLSAEQVDAIAAEVEANHVSDWNGDLAAVEKYHLDPVTLAGILARVKAALPEAFVVVPSVSDLIGHFEKEFARTHGRPASAVDRMTFNRQIMAMTTDQRRAAMPPIEATIGEASAKAEAPASKNAAPMSREAMDARILADTGIDPRTMLVRQRRDYYAAFERETHTGDAAAAERRALEFQKAQGTLSPTQAITLARLQKA